MTSVYGIVGLALGCMLLPYVLGPILIKATHTQALKATFRELNPVGNELPDDARAFFESALPPLLELGFAPVACMEMSNYVKNVRVYFTFLEHRDNRDYAMLDAFYLASAGGSLQARSAHTEFIALLTTDRSVTTSNTAEVLATPANPLREKYCFKSVPDAKRLYRAHRALVERAHAGERMPFEPFERDAGILQRSIEGEHAHLVRLGYLHLDDAAQVYRLTWKGAFLMTWRLCWPVKQFRVAAIERKAEALLQELGV